MHLINHWLCTRVRTVFRCAKGVIEGEISRGAHPLSIRGDWSQLSHRLCESVNFSRRREVSITFNQLRSRAWSGAATEKLKIEPFLTLALRCELFCLLRLSSHHRRWPLIIDTFYADGKQSGLMRKEECVSARNGCSEKLQGSIKFWPTLLARLFE